MNLSHTVDTIVELRSRGGPSDERVADYLKSILEAGNAHVHVQPVLSDSRVLLMGTVTALSIVFLAGVLRRRHGIAFVSALAIPLILLFELSAGLHVVTWATRDNSTNISIHFPVQDATREVIIGTHYPEPIIMESDRFTKTVAAFLLPVTLVITLLGLWRLAVFFGKLDFEDAHTIAMIMGTVCILYYALAFGMNIDRHIARERSIDPMRNAGSLAVLTALAEDLSGKYLRLENTSVTLAFFGRGRAGGSGAEEFAWARALDDTRTLPAYFIGCERAGRGGAHGYVPGEFVRSEPEAGRDLIRTFNRAALKMTGAPLEIFREETINSNGFIRHGYEAIVVSTLPPDAGQDGKRAERGETIDRGQLLLTLQLIEASLVEFDKPQYLKP